jgi:cytochrome c-type protein NapB
MKINILLISTLVTIFGIAGCQSTGNSIDEASVGIGADGVFNDPSPSTFDYPTTKAGKSDRITKSYPTAPPMVPHIVDKYLPITMEENECMDCHDRPKYLDRVYVKGKKLTMTRSHYGGFKGDGEKDEVSGARYNCTQCHAPVSDAKPLVENTF